MAKWIHMCQSLEVPQLNMCRIVSKVNRNLWAGLGCGSPR